MWHDAAVDILTLIIIIRMQIYRDSRFRGYLFRAPSNENRQVRKMSRQLTESATDRVGIGCLVVGG